MSLSFRIISIIVGILCLSAIACGLISEELTRAFEEKWYQDDMKATIDAGERLGVDLEGSLPTLRPDYPTPTLRPTRTKHTGTLMGDQDKPKINPGTCAWVLTADSDPYPSGEVGTNMQVERWRSDTSIATSFFHGKSSCETQNFRTYHEWVLDEIYYPGKIVSLYVIFAWENIGTLDCATLMNAGGLTTMSSDHFELEIGNNQITMYVNPSGNVYSTYDWVVPEGTIGERMTITQHASTGSFGRNIRWYYEYVCE